MADPLIINPTLTLAGQQAALAASNQGVSLNLTHISYGMGKYAPVGNEVALKTPVSIKVSLAGGSRPTPYQLRMLSAWRENIGGEKAITEIAFWAGNVLAFIWSTAAGQAAFTKTDGVTAVHFIDLGLSSVPAASISITIDPQESVALAAVAAHEGASNAHPDYVKHSLFPDAQADLWAEVVGGSANAIALTMPAEVVLNAYRKGQVFRFMSSYANTSTVTMNVNGLGVKPVVKSGGNALIPSDLKANSVYDVVYDGTRFQLNGGVGGGQFYIEYPTAAATAKQVAYQGTYTPGSMMVFVGGAKLPQSGFTATDGQNVTLTAASAANIVVGTVVTIVALSTFAVADTYTKGEYQSFAATQAQAQDIASAVLDRWMSPQRVREAITARIQASTYDGAVSRLLVPGSFGLGGLTLPAFANINTLTVSGIYGWGAATIGRPVDSDAGEVIHMVGDTAAYASQLVTSHLSGRTWFRRKSNNVWSQVELFHSGNQLALGTTPAAGRTALELGTAAGADLTTSDTDETVGRVLRVGDFGLGRRDLPDYVGDLNALVATGFYFAGSAATNAPAGGISGMLIVLTNASNNTQQLFMTQGSTRFYQRSSAAGVWSQWVESWHTGNLVKTTSNSDATLGSMLKVGDFGIGAKALYLNNVLATVDDVTLPNGIYAASNATTGTKPATYGILMQEGRNNVAGTQGRVCQTFIDVDQAVAPRIYHRVYISATSAWGAWVEDWNSSNLFKTTNAMDVTPGAVTRVGDFGLGVTQTMGANAITTGTDLNNLIVSGLYGQAQNVQATLALNYPVAKAGTLLVQRGGSQIVTQTYQEYDSGRIWSRGIYSGTPSAWVMSWDTGTLVKTTSTLDTTIGRMVQVGDFGLGIDGGVKLTFATDADWAKPGGWSGFIDLAASRAKGVTTPTAVGFTSNYGAWQILGRRDSGGGYMGIYTDYGTGRMWVGYATTNTVAPTFQEIYSRASVPAFMQTLLDDATQAEAQVTLGISNMINGITYKSVAGSSNVVLTAAEANVGIIILTGALTGNITVSVPAAFGLWNVLNRTTGAFTITFKTVAAGSAGQLVLQGKQAQLFSDGTQIYYGATQFEAGYFRGEVITESTNSYRMVNNLIGSFWRQDSNALYLMLTNSGDPLGTYNALRPMSVNLTTGKVAMSQGLTVPTMADGANTLDAATCLFVQNALAVYGLAQVSATETNLNTLRGTQFFGFSSSATGAVPGAGYDAVGFQIEAAGQRTQFGVAAGGLLYVRTDDSTNQAGFDPWVPQASQDYVAAQLAAYGVGTLISTPITDYNEATTGGLFRASSTALNPPPLAANYSVIVAPFNDGGCLQVATQLGGPSRSFTRTQAGNGWTAWRESIYSDSPAFSGLPTAPTALVSALGNQLATLDYVSSWARKYDGAGISISTAQYNVQAVDVGRWFNISAANAVATLVAASTLTDGLSYVFRNASGTNITLSSTSVFSTTVSATTLVLAPGEVVEVTSNANQWWVTNRSSFEQLARNASPNLTGSPTAPTAALGDKSLVLANTAFTQASMAVWGLGAVDAKDTSNLNTATAGGWYRADSTTLNTPSPSYLAVLTSPFNSNGCRQDAVILDPANPRAFFRVQGGGTWSAWKETATAELVYSVDNQRCGEVTHFAMSTPPPGFLKRNGAAVSRTTYANLFAKIGTTYGAGDGSTTFNLPDDRGYFDRGWVDGGVYDTGRAFGSHQDSTNASHTHTGTAVAAGAHSHVTSFQREKITANTVTDPVGGNAVLGDIDTDGIQPMTSSTAAAHTHTLSIAAAGGTESRPLNTAYLACIKY